MKEKNYCDSQKNECLADESSVQQTMSSRQCLPDGTYDLANNLLIKQ